MCQGSKFITAALVFGLLASLILKLYGRFNYFKTMIEISYAFI